uniref:Uncharacterized protein n=1 Tax=Octopus bimaculoides TaxID=37653 RepID=A0A0L8G5S4_OCTBM
MVGGARYNFTGGGSNLLCLPNNMMWLKFSTELEQAATIYGSEYQLENNVNSGGFSNENARRF